MSTTLAPGRLGSQKPQGYRFEVFQRYPWPGKLQLRGDSALAQRLAALETPESELSRQWDREHDEYLAARLMQEHKLAGVVEWDSYDGSSGRWLGKLSSQWVALARSKEHFGEMLNQTCQDGDKSGPCWNSSQKLSSGLNSPSNLMLT